MKPELKRKPEGICYDFLLLVSIILTKFYLSDVEILNIFYPKMEYYISKYMFIYYVLQLFNRHL